MLVLLAEPDYTRLKEYRQDLNDLLEAYHLLIRVVDFVLQDPAHPPRRLDLFYRRELAPAIEAMIKKLGLKRADGSNQWVPFPDLFHIGALMAQHGVNEHDMRRFANDMYGDLKDFVEDKRTKAATLAKSDGIKALIKKGEEHLSHLTAGAEVPRAGDRPEVFLEKGWWKIAPSGDRKASVRLLKQGSWSGELLGFLGSQWGVARTRESVFDHLAQFKKGKPDGTQIETARSEINRTLKERGLRQISLIPHGSTSWSIDWKETQE